MNISLENLLIISATIVTLLLLLFAVDWRFFGDWVVVFLFKGLLDAILGSIVVEMNYLEYPVRVLPQFFDTSVLFELWVFPVLCILYNQVTRERGLWPIIYYAVLWATGITIMEVPIERYTDLLLYKHWHGYTSLVTLTGTFLLSRAFIAFYRWGCLYFGKDEPRLRID